MNNIDKFVAIILNCLDSQGNMLACDENRVMDAYSNIAMLAVDMAEAMEQYMSSFEQKRCNPEIAYNRFNEILHSQKYVNLNKQISKDASEKN
jgi:hypothetical protein